jgi:hypothetical protein
MWSVNDWYDTGLELEAEGNAMRNLFTRNPVYSTALRDVFSEFPVAMLVEGD